MSDEDEDDYINQCWMYSEKAKPGRRLAKGGRSMRDLLDGLLRQMPQSEEMRFAELVMKWPELVGAKLAAEVRPLELRGDELWLKAGNPIWKTELRFHQEALLDRSAQILGRRPSRIRVL